MMVSQPRLLNRSSGLTRLSPAAQHRCVRFSSAKSFQMDRPFVIRSINTNNSTTKGPMRAARGDGSSACQGGATEGSAVAPSQKSNQLRELFEAAARCVAVGGLCLAMVLSTVNPALAARSGGYMGGSNFSSRSNMGSGLGSSSLGGSSLGSSSKFGGGSSYTNSFSYRGSSAPGLTLRRAPSVSAFFGPPVFYGGGYGYGYGAPVAGGGGGLGTILLLGVLAAVVWTMFSSGGSGAYDDGYDVVGDERVTVCKLQVGLLGTARQLQRDLERIADRADTDSPSGLHYILQETVLALLRNPDYCIYGASSVNNKRGLEAGESRFNELSMEERSKFKQETLVNVGGRRKSGSYSGGGGSQGVPNELIVVTILVAIEGGLQIPNVTSLEDLRTVLNKLGSIGQDQTLAVEVLWTPQDEGDYYTRDEIFQDYPTLNNL